jgi:hypothetical protein
MGKHPKVPKTLERKLLDLDDHLFLLREHLHCLRQGEAHLKALSAELRVLICFSSNTEGLLWRLVDELEVSDKLYLHVAGELKNEHSLARGIHLALMPIQYGGLGHPQLPPNYYSLRDLIKEHEAVFISGKGLTHEYLIKVIAQQMGSAHEDNGIEPTLVELGQIFFNGVEPYVPILAMDAKLTLQVGERVLEEAEEKVGFKRQTRAKDYGNLSIVVRFGLRQTVAGRIPLFRMRSYVSEVEIACLSGPLSLVFEVKKKGNVVKEIYAQYPDEWQFNTDAVFVFSYCSHKRLAHAISNDKSQDDGIECDIGYFHANEIRLEEVTKGYEEFVYKQFVLSYAQLLSPKDCLGILDLPPDAYGLWKFEDEAQQDEVFPTE